MSGNIKYIGELDKQTAKPLPTKGMFSRSNSDGKDAALNKFISSFTQESSFGTKNTKTEMEREFPELSKVLKDEGPEAVKKKLQVKQEPANNKDCSVFTVSKKSEAVRPHRGLSIDDLGQLVNEQNEASPDKVIKRLKTENQQLRERNTELETDKNTSTANLQTQIADLTRQYDSDKDNLTFQLSTQDDRKNTEIRNLNEELQNKYEIEKNKLISELTLQLQTQSKEREDDLLQQLLKTTSEIQNKGNAIPTIEVEIQQLKDLNFSLEKMLIVLLDELEKNVVETKPISDIESMSAVALIVDSIIDTKEIEFEEGPVDSLDLPQGSKPVDSLDLPQVSKPVDSLDLPPNIKPISNTTTPSSNIISKQQPHETFVRLSKILQELSQNNEAMKEVIGNRIANNNKITQSRTTVEFMPFTESKQTVETQTENAPIPEETTEVTSTAETTEVTSTAKTANIYKPNKPKQVLNPVITEEVKPKKKPETEVELKNAIVEIAENYFKSQTLIDSEKNKIIFSIKRKVREENDLKELIRMLKDASGKNPKFDYGGGSKASRRHGNKRIKSRKPRALKNKTKTRRYRKRSFTRRRK